MNLLKGVSFFLPPAPDDLPVQAAVSTAQVVYGSQQGPLTLLGLRAGSSGLLGGSDHCWRCEWSGEREFGSWERETQGTDLK